MNRNAIEAALASAVEELRASGDSWWPGTEIAPIAYRRWISFSRRIRGRPNTIDVRINDLVKGLQSHFEPETPYTHPNDWRALGVALAGVLQQFEIDGKLTD